MPMKQPSEREKMKTDSSHEFPRSFVACFKTFQETLQEKYYERGVELLHKFIQAKSGLKKNDPFLEDLCQVVCETMLFPVASPEPPTYRKIAYLQGKLFLNLVEQKSESEIKSYIVKIIRTKKRELAQGAAREYFLVLRAVEQRLRDLVEKGALKKAGGAFFRNSGSGSAKPRLGSICKQSLKKLKVTITALCSAINPTAANLPETKPRASYQGLSEAISALVDDPENAGHLWSAVEILNVLQPLFSLYPVDTPLEFSRTDNSGEEETVALELHSTAPIPAETIHSYEPEVLIDSWLFSKVAYLRRQPEIAEMVHAGFLEISFRSPELAIAMGVPDAIIQYMRGGDSREKIGNILNCSKGTAFNRLEEWETFLFDCRSDLEQFNIESPGRALSQFLARLQMEYGVPGLPGVAL